MLPGFADPVGQSQSCFRAALEALSRPGRVLRVEAPPPAPAPLAPAAAALLLTLCDAETPVALLGAPEAEAWLAFHAGSPVAAPGRARFVLAAEGLPPFQALELGSDEAPQDSATLILQLAGLEEGPGLVLTGPGIAGEHLLAADGLPADFPERWAANNGLFPRGVDLFLCCGDRLAGLPRTTRVRRGG